VQEWERIMHELQQRLPGTPSDQYWWMEMERVFSLDEQ
jgi:hypothetical protein